MMRRLSPQWSVAREILPFLLAALSTPHAQIAQTVFDDWRSRLPNPPANTLQTALYAEGRFVAAGQHATVVTSVTGNVWETRYLKAGFTCMGIVYADGVYVMIDREGQVARSTDLEAWRVSTIGASSLTDLIHAEGRFVAVGYPSRIYSSQDGETWTPTLIEEESLQLEGIVFSNGQYITIARGGKILRSTDLEQWTAVFPGYPGTENRTDNWQGIAYFNGRFIAYGPLERLLVSDDGLSWAEVPLDFDSSLTDHVVWKDRLWIAGDSDAILHSGDGLTWSRIPIGVDVSANAIAASPERIVALASRGEVYTSDDGVVWTQVAAREFDDFNGLALKENTYVAVADKKRFLRSTDGVNWETVFDGRESNDLYEGIGTVGGRFVAVASRGRIAWSFDGLDWNTETTVPFTAIVRGLSNADGVLFAGCDSGYLASTTDGLNWTERRIAENGTGSLHAIAQVSHFNGLYFAAGGNGFLARSADLENWEPISPGGTTAPFKRLLYFNNRYILLPASGSRILFSDDLLTWTDDRRIPVIRATGAWIFDNRVIVSSLAGLYTSEDGASFVEHSLPFAGFRELTYDGIQYVAVGANSVIATTGSTPLSAIQLSVEGKGSVSRSPEQALYSSSTVVRLTAQPESGQQFLWWETATGVEFSPFLDLVPASDTTVKAVFASQFPPVAAFNGLPEGVAIEWAQEEGWVLHQSEDLVNWTPSNGVRLVGDQGLLDTVLTDSGNLFFQFRLRTP